MADPRRRLSTNVAGDFFVDESCIDCDACRWIAPATFDEDGGHSRVHRQPATPDEVHCAELAVIACPTGSIGVTTKHDLAATSRAFPSSSTPTSTTAATTPSRVSAPRAG